MGTLGGKRLNKQTICGSEPSAYVRAERERQTWWTRLWKLPTGFDRNGAVDTEDTECVLPSPFTIDSKTQNLKARGYSDPRVGDGLVWNDLPMAFKYTYTLGRMQSF